VNKLPVLQKKIKILAKCIKQLDDTNRTSVNEVICVFLLDKVLG
jgi:hypothetical protein